MRILIGLNDEASLRSLGTLLRGHQVLVCGNVPDAEKMLAAEPVPDVAILDAKGGLELCRRFKAAKGSSFCLIIIAGSSGMGDVAAALEAGADDYVLLPLDPTELGWRLRTASRVLTLEKSLASREVQAGETIPVVCEVCHEVHGFAPPPRTGAVPVQPECSEGAVTYDGETRPVWSKRRPAEGSG